MEPIEFTAVVYKVQTLVDCGVRVTLDLPETAIMQMAELAECKRAGVALRVTANPEGGIDGQPGGHRKIHI
jgi:hypothetical protein